MATQIDTESRVNRPPQAGPRKQLPLDARPWRGAKREYDLFKEVTVGIIVVALVALGLAAVLGSPDEKPVTLKTWSLAASGDFAATATAELARTSDTATYGPPYSTTPGATQTLGPIDLQSLSGTRLPIDTAQAFVIRPLTILGRAGSAVSSWNASTPAQDTAWATAYTAALAKAPGQDPTRVASGDYGPVPVLVTSLLAAAKTGGVDAAIQSEPGFFGIDYTPRILFLGDGSYFPGLAAAQHLTGSQWGMMNETGSYPGQSWLWLFSFWYQLPAIGNLPNADLVVVFFMLIMTLTLALVPFIPGLRSLPRIIPIHRLIWRDYYRRR